MSLIPYYLKYTAEVCGGQRPLPEGFSTTETDPMKRGLELQRQLEEIGVPEFVRRCAAQTGDQIPEEEYDDFDMAELTEFLEKALEEIAPPTEPMDPMHPKMVEAPAAQPEDAADGEPVRTETRDIFEVFLDSICLEDELVNYLIDVLLRKSDGEFRILSRAAARTVLSMNDFLAWLGNRELLGSTDEQACVRIMDGCLDRLVREQRVEVAAALISGDQATFEIFRTEAPELVHLPEAIFEWFNKYYLSGYYPVRFILRTKGVVFPIAQ